MKLLQSRCDERVATLRTAHDQLMRLWSELDTPLSERYAVLASRFASHCCHSHTHCCSPPRSRSDKSLASFDERSISLERLDAFQKANRVASALKEERAAQIAVESDALLLLFTTLNESTLRCDGGFRKRNFY